MLNEQEVLNKLSEVVDPEIGLNIVDLGLVYDVQIDADNFVNVKMTLTTRGCPMHDTIAAWAQRALLNLPQIKGASVEIVWDPPWHPGMMSASARQQLGWR
jgi:metal-sulfur cluster biosynthetic enzyme